MVVKRQGLVATLRAGLTVELMELADGCDDGWRARVVQPYVSSDIPSSPSLSFALTIDIELNNRCRTARRSGRSHSRRRHLQAQGRRRPNMPPLGRRFS